MQSAKEYDSGKHSAAGRRSAAGIGRGRGGLAAVLNAAPQSATDQLRDECLNEHLFSNLRHARQMIEAWRDDYSHHRPHTSLDGLTPCEYHHRAENDQTLNRANL